MVLVIAAVAVVYLFSGYILTLASQKAIDYAVSIAAQNDIKLDSVKFQSVKPNSFTSITWKGLSASGMVTKSSVAATDRKVSGSVEEITLSVENIQDRVLLLVVKGAKMNSQDQDASPQKASKEGPDQLEGGDLKIKIQISSMDPRGIISQVEGLSRNVMRFLKEGRSTIPIEFSGTVAFKIREQPLKAKVSVKREGDEYCLVMDKDDLIKICKQLGQKVYDTEMEVVAENPIRAPRLLKIRDYAEDTAYNAYEKNHLVPEDAYRHVLWSYLLTNAFGEEFAEKVTTAHETGATDNSPGESEQDYNNNAIGRRYARAGYAEASILRRVLTDPQVITYASEAHGVVK